MSKWILGILAVGLILFSASSAEAAKKGNKPKGENRKHTPGDFLKRLDTNDDKKISIEEFKAFKPKSGKTGKDGKEFDAEKVFKHKDKNNDGFLTAEEFKRDGKPMGQGKKK
jgi:hypothetical protein